MMCYMLFSGPAPDGHELGHAKEVHREGSVPGAILRQATSPRRTRKRKAKTELLDDKAPKKMMTDLEIAMEEHTEVEEWPSSYEGREAGVDFHAGGSSGSQGATVTMWKHVAENEL